MRLPPARFTPSPAAPFPSAGACARRFLFTRRTSGANEASASQTIAAAADAADALGRRNATHS